MIAIIDYGAGNIFSVKNALDYLGFENKLTSDKDDLIKADALILPGVGAFPEAMKMLGNSGLIDVITNWENLTAPAMFFTLSASIPVRASRSSARADDAAETAPSLMLPEKTASTSYCFLYLL